MAEQKRSFTFTINNYTTEQADQLENYIKENFNVVYSIAGLETAPTTGTKHIQGYLNIKSAKTLSSVIKKFKKFNNAHIEIAKGTAEQNQKYCSKENNILYQIGTIPRKGKRTDLESIASEIKEGAGLVELYQKHPNHIKYIEKLYEHLQPKRDSSKPPEVIYIYGASGVGKSRLAEKIARDKYNEEDIYYKSGFKWFNGYDNQKCIIWNDFRDEDYIFNHFLQLLDRYPVNVEFKGGIRQFKPDTIIITSIKPIHHQYQNINEDKTQLYRRIGTYYKLDFESLEEKQFTIHQKEFKIISKVQNPFDDISIGYNDILKIIKGNDISNNRHNYKYDKSTNSKKTYKNNKNTKNIFNKSNNESGYNSDTETNSEESEDEFRIR